MELALDRLVAAALAVTIFAFASGSTIEYRVLIDARVARWYCLVALLLLAGVYAMQARPAPLPVPFLAIVAALVAVAVASTVWSVAPTLTMKRAASFAALIAIAACLLHGTVGRPARARRLLIGLVVGAVAVAVAGLVVLAVDRDAAIQPATTEYPARYRGYEQNPNTAAMLFALATPLACLPALDGRRRALRGAALAVLALFVGSLAASGARGPMIAALVGAVVFAAASPLSIRRRIVLVLTAVAVFAVCLGISQIPDAKPTPPQGAGEAPATRRTLFTSSGRSAAWRGALRQAEARPLTGYGFGTEAQVFVDRYDAFVSDLPENSYIGAALQLGIVGFALLAGAAAYAFSLFLRRLPGADDATRLGAAFAGAAAAGLVVGATQSYLFSVGNLATLTAWICLFLLVAMAPGARARP